MASETLEPGSYGLLIDWEAIVAAILEHT